MCIRDRAKIDPQRDKLNQLSVDKVNNAVESAKTKIVGNEMDPTFNELRWMIEELRVSLFAQQLGTAYPISEKRILNFIQSECG